MDYSEYTSRGTDIKEYLAEVSDQVKLNVIEFIPKTDSSEKPIVLFVAGWISMITGWKPVVQKITPAYRTVYLETREKSSSVVPQGKRVSFTMDRLAEDIDNIIQKTIPGDRSFIIAGSSLGATAIIQYLAKNRRQPECAILISPVLEFRFPPVLGDIIPLLPPSLYLIIKPLIKWYLRNFRLDKKREIEQVKKYEGTLDAADPYKLKANAIALKNYTIWEHLPGVPVPTLIIGATSDKLHGTDTLKKMLDGLRRSDYRELASNKETHSAKAGELIVNYIRNREYEKIS
jgi:pimeloyl-ACP methyl ester carboxylesterase